MVNQVTTVEEFDAVLKENKSVFVDFFATWCGPCKMVGPVVEKVSETEPNVAFVKVDVDEVGELAQRYGIMSIPALFSFKDGEKAGEIVGFAPEDQIRALADKAK
ncbi:MAG: thioredoxin [Solobacterium sp.]|nr:thioredoxin [Solobacterium sp.]